jgi:hypothetical protein
LREPAGIQLLHLLDIIEDTGSAFDPQFMDTVEVEDDMFGVSSFEADFDVDVVLLEERGAVSPSP